VKRLPEESLEEMALGRSSRLDPPCTMTPPGYVYCGLYLRIEIEVRLKLSRRESHGPSHVIIYSISSRDMPNLV
jgi:hypothetical protein